jgi:Protein tyrosine and serine/threonine kinase
MAPEVALNEPYDKRADVYSWSMVFWHIMALEPPLGSYSPSVFVSNVAIDGDRPEIHKKWSTYISCVMEMAWHHDLRLRPFFDYIITKLCEIIHQLDPDVQLNAGDRIK